MRTARFGETVNRMIDRCKNITLPQTSFAGCNYKALDIKKKEFCKNRVKLKKTWSVMERAILGPATE